MARYSLIIPDLLVISALLILFSPQKLQGAKMPPAIAIKGEKKKNAPGSVTARDLEKLPLTEYTTFNPYEKKRVRYRGVLIRDIVRHYGKPGVKKIIFTAIDGYVIEFNVSEWNRWEIMVATQAEGKYMGVKESGPVKVVFPYDTAGDIDRQIYNRKWIWLVTSIRFE